MTLIPTPKHEHIFLGCFGEQHCWICGKTRQEVKEDRIEVKKIIWK